MEILMTSIYVSEPLKAFRFYTEILGFQKHTLIEEMELAIVKSQTQENGTTLLLEPNGNPIAKTYQQALYQNNLPVIVFGTNNIEYEYDRLKKLGVAFKNPPQKSEWGISTIFDDTFGNWIQLHQEIGL